MCTVSVLPTLTWQKTFPDLLPDIPSDWFHTTARVPRSPTIAVDFLLWSPAVCQLLKEWQRKMGTGSVVMS